MALDRQAAAAGQVFMTGAGFGVLATESVVLRLCAGRPRPVRVRVDALAAVALEAGVVGSALAATIVEVVSAGGREVSEGRLVRARSAHQVELTTPDGDKLATGSGASGDLVSAWRASDADSVIAASITIVTINSNHMQTGQPDEQVTTLAVATSTAAQRRLGHRHPSAHARRVVLTPHSSVKSHYCPVYQDGPIS